MIRWYEHLIVVQVWHLVAVGAVSLVSGFIAGVAVVNKLSQK